MRIDEISMSRADRFMVAFEAASVPPANPMADGRLVGNALFDMFTYGDDGVIIKLFSLRNGSRGAGEGSSALTFLCDLADKFEVKLYAHALSQRRIISERGLNTRALVAFYERYGFVAETPAAASAFQADPLSGLKMVRKPRT